MSRPRPRLVSRRAAGSADAVKDEDDLFRRNRGRTAQHWRQLGQYAAKAASPTKSDDGCDTDQSSPRPRKKKQTKQNTRPRWQATDAARILSSDNDDDEIQIIEPTSRNPRENASRDKRKRSRSRSITPPPELPPHQRANAMILVRQALAVQPRPPSPTFFLDASTDSIDLDPELAKIADAVRQQVKHAHIETERAGGPEAVNIKFWTFKMRRHDTFRELFDGVADLAGVMTDQLVVSHDHRHVFASGTPHSLHMWAEGELEACDKRAAEYIRAHRDPSPSLQDNTPKYSPSTAPQSNVESAAESTEGDKIKLIFRSAATKEKTFPLTVRSTTTCGAIVKAFMKAAGLPGNYSRDARTSTTSKKVASFPQLMVDGDKLDSETEIGDVDLEDGDLVEIIGV